MLRDSQLKMVCGGSEVGDKVLGLIVGVVATYYCVAKSSLDLFSPQEWYDGYMSGPGAQEA